MAAPGINIAAAISCCDDIVDRIDVGATNAEGRIRIFTGSKPASVDDVETGTLLAELLMSNPAFGAAADQAPNARATAGTITDDSSADNAGTAGYFRVIDRNLNGVIDGDVTATSGGGDLELNTVVIAAGAIVSVTAFDFDHLE